jgi:hypothetical protein
MDNNAILFSKIDREDFWVCAGMVFRVFYADTYEGAYNEVKHLLESPEIVEHVVEERCLLCDLFDDDETFVFKRTLWRNCMLVYEFESANAGAVLECTFRADFIHLFN